MAWWRGGPLLPHLLFLNTNALVNMPSTTLPGSARLQRWERASCCYVHMCVHIVHFSFRVRCAWSHPELLSEYGPNCLWHRYTHTHRYAHTPYVHHTCTIMYTNPQTRSCTDMQHVQNTHVLTNTDVHTPHTNAHTYVHAQKCTHNHNHVHTQTYPPPTCIHTSKYAQNGTHSQNCTQIHKQKRIHPQQKDIYLEKHTYTHAKTENKKNLYFHKYFSKDINSHKFTLKYN